MHNFFLFINNKIIILFQVFLLTWVLFIPIKTLFYQASYIGMLILMLFHIFYNHKLKDILSILIKLKDILWIMLCIFLIMTITNMFSEFSTAISWKVEFTYFYRYFFAFILLLYAYQQKIFEKRTLIIYILISLSIQSFYGFADIIMNPNVLKNSFGLQGMTFNRNAFGMMMALGSSIIFGLLIFYKKYHIKLSEFILLSVCFFLFLFSLIFSYSRSSWLLFIVFILTLYGVNAKKISLKMLCLFLCFFVTFVCIFLNIPDLAERLNSIFLLDSSERFKIWLHTFNLIFQKPILGYGLMSYSHIGITNFNGTHNSIIEIFLYTGIIGFIAYSSLLYIILKEQIKIQSLIFLPLSLAIIVALQFDHSIFSNILLLSSLSIFGFFIFEKRI